MSQLKKILLENLNHLEDHLDNVTQRFKSKMGWHKPLKIVPYRGFGNENVLYLKGRVLEDKKERLPQDGDNIWDNILSMYKRLESDEVPGIKVRARIFESEQIVTTDEEGYFNFKINTPANLPTGSAWHNISLDFPEKTDLITEGSATATGQVLIPPKGSLFGVISDIDDTVLISDATNILKSARLVFLHNARTRLPFKGISAFYRALQNGPDATIFNPLFYVSSSAWNLYDLLTDFFSFNGIPKGPLMLRDMGLTAQNFIKSDHGLHKAAQIKHIMDTYPELSFVLIGDSGQKDPEIYLQAIKDYPGRIKVVYIRDVTGDDRDIVVHRIAKEALEYQVEVILVKDTLAAALHAARLGLIDPEALPEITAEKAYDNSKPTGAEAILNGETN